MQGEGSLEHQPHWVARYHCSRAASTTEAALKKPRMARAEEPGLSQKVPASLVGECFYSDLRKF